MENSTQFLKEKIKNSEFLDSAKNLAKILRRREENGFSALVNPEAIPYLSSAIVDLEEAVQNEGLNSEDINTCVKRMCGTINAIGQDLPRTGGLKEDSEILSRVAFNLRDLAENSQRMVLELGGAEDKNLEETKKYFKALLNLAEERWSFVVKKKQLFEQIYG